MFVGEEPFFPLTLVGFEEGAITGACRHEVGDVYELETAGSEGQVGVVAFDGHIDARAMDQVGIRISFSTFRSFLPELKSTTTSQQSFPFFR